MYWPSSHETIKAKLPSTLPVGVEPVLRFFGLLSLTPEEARSLGGEGMYRLYAPAAYWWVEMARWIRSRSWTDCHKWINEHDDELVREVLEHFNSIFFKVWLPLASYTATPSCFLLFE